MRTVTSIFLALYSAMAMTACGGGNGTVEYVQDERIPQEIRAEIHALNDRLLKSLQDDDPSVMSELFAEKIKRKREFERFDEIFASLREWHKDTQVELFHEFYATFTEVGPETWTLTPDGDEEFILRTFASAPRVYFSLLIAKAGSRELLIGIKYVQASDRWRLYAYRINQFRIAGLSAVGWYRQARILHEKKLLLPALMRMTVSRDLLHPLPFLQYEKRAEMMDFLVELESEMESVYGLPIVLSELPAAPSIIKVEPHFLEDDLTVKVHYVTSLEFEEGALKAEAASMTPELAQLFPGFCNDIERVAFTIYSELPVFESKRYLTLGVVTDCNPTKDS